MEGGKKGERTRKQHQIQSHLDLFNDRTFTETFESSNEFGS